MYIALLHGYLFWEDQHYSRGTGVVRDFRENMNSDIVR